MDFEILRRLQTESRTSVLMLTARSDDDYLPDEHEDFLDGF